jgi:hypothetical protein
MRSPVVTKLRPDPITRGTETDVTITGSFLFFMGLETTLTVEPPVTARLLGKSTPTELKVHLTVPRETPPGPRSIVLKTTDGQVSAPFSVVLAPPVIASLAPAVVVRGEKAVLTLQGNNLGRSPGASLPDAHVIVEGRARLLRPSGRSPSTKVEVVLDRGSSWSGRPTFATCSFEVVSPRLATPVADPVAGPRGALDVKVPAPGFLLPFAPA